jgi:SAM-dependent methyltransferase
MNSLDRYNDLVFAWQYEYSEQTSNHGDFEYYLSKLKNIKGKVLELGCGTGRLTIPLKKDGINIVGLDQAKAMIQIARKKASQKKLNISFIIGDALSFSSHAKFRVIIFPYNSITQVAEAHMTKLIRNIKEHLEPEGIFIFDIDRRTQAPRGAPNVRHSPWSEPLHIKELNVTLRRETTFTDRPEKNITVVSYHWEIIHKDRRVEKRKTSMSFSTRPAEWYIEQFEKKGFKLVSHDYIIDSSHKIPKKQSFIELRLTD